jgi:hypothetical protein
MKFCEQSVVSCCDVPELFESVEEAFDDVALLVQFGVIGTLNLGFRLGGMTARPPVRALLSQR